jgi:hypothetical protein
MDESAVYKSSREVVKGKIEDDYKEFRTAARNWSGVYHTFQFGSAVLSAAGALVLKTEFIATEASRNDCAAVLATFAALSITLLTTGRFKDKWEANRVAAFAVRDLAYEIEKDDANCDNVLTSLKRIGLTRNNTIVGLPTQLKLKA